MRRRITAICIASVAVVALLCAAPSNSPLAPRSALAAPTARGALNQSLPTVDFSSVTLNDALDFVRDVSGANLHVDWKALETAGIGKDVPVNLRLRNVQLRKALTLVLREAGGGDTLTFYVDGGVIEITTREVADKQLFTKVYPVEDLLVEVPDFQGPDFNLEQNNSGGRGGGGSGQSILQSNTTDQDKQNTKTRAERAQELIDVITSTIDPDIWQQNGGTAAIRFFNGSLIVTAPRSVHEALGGVVD